LFNAFAVDGDGKGLVGGKEPHIASDKDGTDEGIIPILKALVGGQIDI
jgi:hypothetical protein